MSDPDPAAVHREIGAFLSAQLDSDEAVYLPDVQDALIEHLVAHYGDGGTDALSWSTVDALHALELLDEESEEAGVPVQSDELSWTPLRHILDRFFDAGPLGGIAFLSPASTPELSSIICEGWVYFVWDEGDGEDFARRAFPVDAPPATLDRWSRRVDAFLDGDIDEDWAGFDEWWRTGLNVKD